MRFKSLLFVLALTLAGITPPAARADDEVNFDYFYGALQDQGDWFGTEQYGYVFQPRAAATNATWRPYADGYWSFTEEGWTWISYEDFGWATYHYGRWAKLSDVGWVWVPGYEWAPAWVSWRSSPRYVESAPEVEAATAIEEPESDLIGWAPLPPEASFDAEVGFSGGVDTTYDIGPADYCFVPTRYFGAPVLTPVILAPARNVFFIVQTVNVTNFYYAGGRGPTRIYCGGPHFTHLHRRVERPIPRLVIERRPPTGLGARQPGAPPPMQTVRGTTLQVTAPRIAPPPGVGQGTVGIPRRISPARPANVKAEIARAERVRGWDAPGLQPQAVQAAREQFRRESVPTQPRTAIAGATPPPNAASRIAPPSTPPPAATAAGSAATRVVPTAPVGTQVAPVTSRPPPARAAPGVVAAPSRVARSPDSASDVPPSEVVLGDPVRERNQAELKKRETARQAQQPASEQQRLAEAQREEQLRQQMAADLDRRQRLIVEQQRRGVEAQQQQREAMQQQNAARQQQIEAQRQAQAEGQARLQVQREQQIEQQRQAQAAAQAQRQQQIEAQRQVQADRQREAQAAAQARAQAQAEAARQQQAEAQRRAAEGARRAEPQKGGQSTPTP